MEARIPVNMFEFTAGVEAASIFSSVASSSLVTCSQLERDLERDLERRA